MNIAIVGAGFSGLATAWHLLQKNPNHQVTLFDPHGIGGQASGIAAGLLHPYSGLHAKLSRYAHEGMLATLELLNIAAQNLHQPSYVRSGILRPAISQSQKEDYALCAKKFEDVAWIDAEKFHSMSPLSPLHSSGIHIQSALTVYTEAYLKGLWMACQKLGAKLLLHEIHSLKELEDFDRIVIAAGAAVKNLTDCSFSIVKGQILEFEWPAHLEPLQIPLNSQAYILMSQDMKRCIVGSTYERDFSSPAQDIAKAREEILPKALLLLPQLAEMPIVGVRAGLRVSTPDHLPVIKKINDRISLITGMGSKGLLYHSLYAKKMVDAI